MLIVSSSTVTITTFKELVVVDILLTGTIKAHTKLKVIMGFIDGFLDLCESASRRITKEREVSEFNKDTGMTTEERLSC